MRNAWVPVLLAVLVGGLVAVFAVLVVFDDAPPEGPEVPQEEPGGDPTREFEGSPSVTATAAWVEPGACRAELNGEACHHVAMDVQAAPDDDFPAGVTLWVAQDEQGSTYGSVWVEPREPLPAGEERNVTVQFPADEDVRLQEVRYQAQDFPMVATLVPEYGEPPSDGADETPAEGTPQESPDDETPTGQDLEDQGSDGGSPYMIPIVGRGTGTGFLLFIPRSRFWRGYAVCRCSGRGPTPHGTPIAAGRGSEGTG